MRRPSHLMPVAPEAARATGMFEKRSRAAAGESHDSGPDPRSLGVKIFWGAGGGAGELYYPGSIIKSPSGERFLLGGPGEGEGLGLFKYSLGGLLLLARRMKNSTPTRISHSFLLVKIFSLHSFPRELSVR